MSAERHRAARQRRMRALADTRIDLVAAIADVYQISRIEAMAVIQDIGEQQALRILAQIGWIRTQV